MTKQDLLNAGWKYLLVLLGFYAVYNHSHQCGPGAVSFGGLHKMDGDHMMVFEANKGFDIDIPSKRVEIKKEVNADGDTNMTVTVNGKPADISDLGEEEMHWIEKGESGEKHKKIRIKKMGGSVSDEDVFITKGSSDGKVIKKRIVNKVQD